MISLKRRLILSYSGIFCIAIILLCLVANMVFNNLFAELVQDKITQRSLDIVESILEQYQPGRGHMWGRFNQNALQNLGSSALNQGYLISLQDPQGNLIWDARQGNAHRCINVTAEIAQTMNTNHHLRGNFESRSYPLSLDGQQIATVNIETYAPFFYDAEESRFITSLNQAILVIGALATAGCALISVALATSISRPIMQTVTTAKRMAAGDLTVRIPGEQKIHELRELAQAVNGLAAALEKGEQRQKQLSSDIAHELRTPLTALQGNVEAMIDGIWEPTMERLNSCHEEIIRLHKLVEDLGQLILLERENLRLNIINDDLAEMLRTLIQQYSALAAEKGVQLRAKLVPAPLDADFDKLKQVFGNLISNAVKYTDHGSITVLLEANREGYTVAVSDTGIGIPSEELPLIFERFYRSDKSRNRATGGAGIGLTIALAIVNAHGGKLQAASTDGEGSVFRVYLPLNRSI